MVKEGVIGETYFTFYENVMFHYLVDWPANSTEEDQLVLEVTNLKRVTMLVTIAHGYNDTNASS